MVRQGQRGADVEQTVRTAGHRPQGKILWECKNAANWSESWVAKIRKDREEAGADVGVIVSRALPRGVARMTLVKDVAIVAPEFVHHVAPLLRRQVEQEGRHRVADNAKAGTAERILRG